MQKKSGGLGRGLDALLQNVTLESQSNSVLLIDVTDVDTNPLQPRKSFDEEALADLARSIAQHGIVQPILVSKRGERFLIVAGERRFRAARMAGLQKIPALLTDLEERAMAEVSLIENIQRENLNPMEEAAAFAFLMQQHDFTQEELSARVGKSRSAIANSLRLLDLDADVRAAVASGIISAGHGKMLAGILDKTQQKQLTERIVEQQWSVRQLEQELRGRTGKARKPSPLRSADLLEVERQMREKLCTKVVLSGTESKGSIHISYSSKEELADIYRAIIGEKQF